jgi:hypothetical protein
MINAGAPYVKKSALFPPGPGLISRNFAPRRANGMPLAGQSGCFEKNVFFQNEKLKGTTGEL